MSTPKDDDDFSEDGGDMIPDDGENEKIGEDIDISGDGGLKKKILVKGEGWEKPSHESDVKVHYVGTLADGTKFDSSRDRNEPFSFKIGTGQVIKGWDKGVATMKKGEKSILTCSPEYGYGVNGSPPKIPPNSTLYFEVELISWTSEKDISKNFDKTITKNVLEKGTGKSWENPQYGSLVKYSLIIKKGPKITNEGNEIEGRIGEEQIKPKGLERALKNMSKGEKCEIFVKGKSKYSGQDISEDSLWEVTLHDFEPIKSSWELKTSEKMEKAIELKESGNFYYKEGKLKLAKKKYKHGLQMAEGISSSESNEEEKEEKTKAEEISTTLKLNMTAVCLALKDYQGAIENCDQILKKNSTNVKALLRKGKAENGMNLWNEARRSLNKAIEYSKMNGDEMNLKEAQKELGRVTANEKKQDEKEKGIFGNLFEKMAKMEAQEEQKS